MVNEILKKDENKSNIFAKLKQDYRTLSKNRIKSLTPDYRKNSSFKIQDHIQKLIKKIDCSSGLKSTWAAFQSLPSEPTLNWSEIDRNITWCFPETKEGKLCFVTTDGLVISLSDIDGVFVPALAFNTNGARLGRGMGFYDKTLNGYERLKIGIAYDCNVSDEVPYESHDVKMNYIITESRILDGVDHRIDQNDPKTEGR